MPAVEDPAAHGGDAVAFARPGEQWVLRELQLHLDGAAVLPRAVRTRSEELAGGEDAVIVGIELNERVLIVPSWLPGKSPPILILVSATVP